VILIDPVLLACGCSSSSGGGSNSAPPTCRPPCSSQPPCRHYPPGQCKITVKYVDGTSFVTSAPPLLAGALLHTLFRPPQEQ
jgi:hypothetical protein